MLDDHDQEKLRKIQNDLATEDPAFVRSFEKDQYPSPLVRHTPPYTATVWIFVAASILGLVSLALGTLSSAVVFFVVAAVVAAREFRDTPSKAPRRRARWLP